MPHNKMRRINNFILFTLLTYLLFGCAVLPKTLAEDDIIVVSNCKWIAKIGKSTLSEGVANPVLKNVNTGESYKVQYRKKPFTMFYSIPKGTYVVDEIILGGGQIQATFNCADLVNEFHIDEDGVYFIGGVNFLDYQTRFDYKVYDWSTYDEEVQSLRSILSSNTSISDSVEINTIEDVFIKERWEQP
jgi:hypothetical protein